MDKRDEIIDEVLKKEGWSMGGDRHIYKCCMDEYMKATCLELLEYMAKNKIECGVDKKGEFIFWYAGEFISKEELFSNFL